MSEMRSGYVYFIREDARGLIKIGWTEGNPWFRLYSLQRGNPSVLSLLGAIRGTRQRERELHDLFAKDQETGEWFRRSTSLLAYIKSCSDVPEQPRLGQSAIKTRTRTERLRAELSENEKYEHIIELLGHWYAAGIDPYPVIMRAKRLIDSESESASGAESEKPAPRKRLGIEERFVAYGWRKARD